MVWALLAILGVPIWLIVGALAGALLSRWRFKAQPGVFRLKERQVDNDKWPRRTAYGRVVHDVLVLNQGLAMVRTTLRGIRSVSEAAQHAQVAPFDQSEVFDVVFDDGSHSLLAVERAAAAHFQSLG